MKPMITIQTLLLSFLLAELALHADCQKRCWFAKRTRNGEECSGPMKHLSPELARYVLPEVRMIGHATDTGHEQIGNHRAFVPVNFRTIQINCIIGTSQEGVYLLFDRLGRNFPNYRPGFRWCNSCAKRDNEESQQEPEYTPPPKVFPIF